MAGNSTVEDVPPPQYKVFINFRGDKLRKGFVSHLVHALKINKIRVFSDADVDRGEYQENLLKRIEESRIVVAILSTNYNESAWSLRELAKIKECKDERKLVVIPIFYKVSTSTVENMSDQLDKAITSLKGGDATTKKKEWEEALKWITSIAGIRVKEDSNESKKVQKIVKAVYNSLIKIQSEGSQEASVDPSENIETEISSGRDFLDRTFTNSPMDGKVEPRNIQVFISFREDQLRNNFFGHLVAALRGSGINFFIGIHKERGEDLNILFKRIEDSGIAIVVFSGMYTESKWCLDELVKIQERVHQGLLKVLPVYYKVTPTNVKRLKGEFGDNFRVQEYIYGSEEPKIKRWKEAIESVSRRFALAYDEKSVLESDFIKNIVKEVLKMLQAIPQLKAANPLVNLLPCGENQAEA